MEVIDINEELSKHPAGTFLNLLKFNDSHIGACDITGVSPVWEMHPDTDEFFYITPDKCTECKGFHDEPQCAAVCPVDCCVPDPDHEETEDVLMGKKDQMHF